MLNISGEIGEVEMGAPWEPRINEIRVIGTSSGDRSNFDMRGWEVEKPKPSRDEATVKRGAYSYLTGIGDEFNPYPVDDATRYSDWEYGWFEASKDPESRKQHAIARCGGIGGVFVSGTGGPAPKAKKQKPADGIYDNHFNACREVWVSGKRIASWTHGLCGTESCWPGEPFGVFPGIPKECE